MNTDAKPVSADKRIAAIAGSLRARIAAGHLYRLPPVRILAKELSVDSRIVLAAVRLLRDEGLVCFAHGTAIEVVPPEGGNQARDTRGSADALYAHLVHGIEQGIYRAGTPLPRRKHFAAGYHMSDHTISKVYSRLCTEGLVHKRGRTFYVGSERNEHVVTLRSPGLILIVTPRLSTWSGLRNERTGRFAESFSQEAENNEVQLRTVAVSATEGSDTSLATILQPEHLGDYVRKHHSRYLGALVVDRVDNSAFDVEKVCRKLSRFNRPVVCFHAQELASAQREAASWYRCGEDPDEFARAGLRYLVDRGHRGICWVGSLDGDWGSRRESVMRAAAKVMPGVRWSTWADEARDMIDAMRREGCPGVLEALMGSGRKSVGKAIRCIEADAARAFSETTVDDPVLSALEEQCGHRADILGWPGEHLLPPLLNPSITAFVAPRDRAAKAIVSFLRRELDLVIPRDLSLLSFDNYIDEPDLPVTTVDRGYAALAYRTFHTIYGDSPSRRSRNRLLVAEPRVVERGSVSFRSPS